jgi:hypothetical protein
MLQASDSPVQTANAASSPTPAQAAGDAARRRRPCHSSAAVATSAMAARATWRRASAG